MRVTYRITEGDCRDDWSNYLDHQNNAPDYNKQKQQLINQIIKIVNNTYNHKCEVDIDKIADAVIAKTKAHETKQSTNIKQNKQDINDINGINIWNPHWSNH